MLLLQVGLIFAAVAGAYERLIDMRHRKNIHVFQFLYYISSFFGLFGSHTTSFLLSAEVSCSLSSAFMYMKLWVQACGVVDGTDLAFHSHCLHICMLL